MWYVTNIKFSVNIRYLKHWSQVIVYQIYYGVLSSNITTLVRRALIKDLFAREVGLNVLEWIQEEFDEEEENKRGKMVKKENGENLL